MNGTRLLLNWCGDLAGYQRSRIRREVCQNACKSAGEIGALSATLFQRRVHDALTRFPCYAEKVRQHCGSLPKPGDIVSPFELPVWTRQDQRELFASISVPPVRGAFVHATGGSTGEPTRFYVTRDSYEWRMAMADRGYAWAEAEEGRRSVYVWGSPIKPLGRLAKWRSDLSHALQKRLYFDSFVFDARCKEECCRAIERFRPHALVGYAGNLVELALYVRSRGRLAWRARTAVTAAEGLVPGQRELIQAVLADEVYLSYGSREFSLIGMECGMHRGYHVSADNLLVEVVDERGQPLMPGQMGRIVITDLRNDANPFVRYEIGDWGELTADRCPCSLPFPLLGSVGGRLQEFLLAADGSKVTALFVPHLLKEYPDVRGYQIEQTQPGAIRVCLLADQEPSRPMADEMGRAFRQKLGETTDVTVMRVKALKRGRSGKTPIVVDPRQVSCGGSACS